MKRFAISLLAGFASGIIGLIIASWAYKRIVHPGIQSMDGFLDIGAAALTGFMFVGLAGFLVFFKMMKKPKSVNDLSETK